MTQNDATSIFRGFAKSVRRNPDALALTFQNRQWSYRALHDAVCRAAKKMEEAGVHAGDRAAFLSRNSDTYMIGWLATQLIGAIHVPINFMLRPAEIAYILNHAAPSVLFASDEFRANAAAALDEAKPSIRLTNTQDLLVESGDVPLYDMGPDAESVHVAQLAYTSGTESAPKGALLTDSGLMHQYMSCIEAGEYSQSDVTLHALPLYHCAQMHCFMMPSLLIGGTNYLLERADSAELIETIQARGATSFFAPPTVWIGILGHANFKPEKLRTLKKGYYGASIMPLEVLKSLQDKLPWMRLWNYYGQTEIGPLATVLRPEEHKERPTSAGRPVMFVESRIVDDDMRDVPPGTIGEIVHRSPQLLKGYYRDPAKTADAFRGGWFHTGDLAVADAQGYFSIVDRKKDMIKTGGENVASREVEEAIYTHPAVAEVAVIGLPDDKWVERVCAVVVARPGARLLSEEIISATSSLAPFKRPKQVIFIDQLPKNPSGKILKRELRVSCLQSAAAQNG